MFCYNKRVAIFRGGATVAGSMILLYHNRALIAAVFFRYQLDSALRAVSV
jgi:hypothetical protein